MFGRKYMDRKIIMLIIVSFLLFSTSVFATDNADTGNGDSQSAVTAKAYYKSSEYMYKVSIYVGLSDLSNENSNIKTMWKQIGGAPIYIKPTQFTLSQSALGGVGNKIDYQNGKSLQPIKMTQYINDNPPPVPITNGGNIDAVKSYFGDTGTLNMIINSYASQRGVTREALVSNITYTINNKTSLYPPDDILPTKVNNEYQNQVPWLIVYEPVIISYLKDHTTILAFSATEYALAQKLGYFNFKSGSDGQYISAMTHSDLPNSIFLEESWFGFPVVSALPEGVRWSDDRIISGGGWGMRLLKANATNVVENNTSYDYEYRANTDVITSVRVYASGDITPDNRQTSKEAYSNPTKNTATVTLTANGYSKSTEIVLPSGGSELVWLKWHTPTTPGMVDIQVTLSGNSQAYLDGNSRSATLKGKVVDLTQNIPPNPTANDRYDGFFAPSLPVKADKTYASWGTYSSSWAANWVWHSKWVWNSQWVSVPQYGWIVSIADKSKRWGIIGYTWIDNGYWRDEGSWSDEGHWTFDYTTYYASLTATFDLAPDDKVPTATNDTMKSGYGVKTTVSTTVSTNAPNSHITYAQNVIAYFPEFKYQKYWRVLDMTSGGVFQFKSNKYSTYNSRVHFTPLWYPDGKYNVYAELIDFWTPDGMLRMNLNDGVNISGNLYSDWHIGPK